MLAHVVFKPKQPKTCKGCIWGNWDGMKQFCSKQTCIKPKEAVGPNELN